MIRYGIEHTTDNLILSERCFTWRMVIKLQGHVKVRMAVIWSVLGSSIDSTALNSSSNAVDHTVIITYSTMGPISLRIMFS